MTYTATIQHHSIASAETVHLGTTDLRTAKRRATSEFGGGFSDHTIVIMAEQTPCNPSGIVSERRIGGGKWLDRA